MLHLPRKMIEILIGIQVYYFPSITTTSKIEPLVTLGKSSSQLSQRAPFYMFELSYIRIWLFDRNTSGGLAEVKDYDVSRNTPAC